MHSVAMLEGFTAYRIVRRWAGLGKVRAAGVDVVARVGARPRRRRQRRTRRSGR